MIADYMHVLDPDIATTVRTLFIRVVVGRGMAFDATVQCILPPLMLICQQRVMFPFYPTLNAGQTGFERVNGPLVLAAERARKEPNAKHFLVIDEINRGNVAKVFGELYFLLEYRNENVRLQYHGEEDEPFPLPGNLYIIGTMNTADRSIALVDLALRRRFYFVDCHPDKEPIKGLLLRRLSDNVPEMDWVAGIFLSRTLGCWHAGESFRRWEHATDHESTVAAAS